MHCDLFAIHSVHHTLVGGRVVRPDKWECPICRAACPIVKGFITRPQPSFSPRCTRVYYSFKWILRHPLPPLSLFFLFFPSLCFVPLTLCVYPFVSINNKLIIQASSRSVPAEDSCFVFCSRWVDYTIAYIEFFHGNGDANAFRSTMPAISKLTLRQ